MLGDRQAGLGQALLFVPIVLLFQLFLHLEYLRRQLVQC